MTEEQIDYVVKEYGLRPDELVRIMRLTAKRPLSPFVYQGGENEYFLHNSSKEESIIE